MSRKLLRTILLPGVIFLFSVLVLGHLGWACDEHDYPDKQCYKQLDIKWVDLDLVGNWIYIWGEHFDNGDPPVVTLGGIHLGDIRFTEEWIVAKLPSVPKDIPYGQYGLRVSTGDGHKCKDKYSVKIHPAPPEKPPCPPPPCTPCPEQCQCPPGPEGPQGPPGITGWDIAQVTIPPQTTELTNPPPMVATAFCANGYRVTGGGFSQNDLDIIKSGPLEVTVDGVTGAVTAVVIGNGWGVVGKRILGLNTTLTVYAICACVDPKGCPKATP